MIASAPERRSLRDCIEAAAKTGRLHGRTANADVGEFLVSTIFGAVSAGLAGRTVVLCAEDPVLSAAALVELDGLAGSILLCPPELTQDQIGACARISGADAYVSECPLAGLAPMGLQWIRIDPSAAPAAPRQPGTRSTKWILSTSGTSGAPKLVVHDLASLTAAIPADDGGTRTWATFYDIRRYGGLQILLRALLAGVSLVLGEPSEPQSDLLARMVRFGATHLTGTPSHWRKALMDPGSAALSPNYVRLSGEVADQALLDALRHRFPEAELVHAFATTEAGVCFEVVDGRAGFPTTLLGDSGGRVEMRLADGSLHVRSARTASGYLGRNNGPLLDHEGYLDTGDLVEQHGERLYFAGRRSGVINVGGLKVHPEEIEAVINSHPLVRMARVHSRASALTGQLVAADVLLARPDGPSRGDRSLRAIEAEILASCRASLAPYKVPATIRFVTDLPVTPAGKIARADA